MLTAARMTLISPIGLNDWTVENCMSWYVRVDVFRFLCATNRQHLVEGFSLALSGFGGGGLCLLVLIVSDGIWGVFIREKQKQEPM